MKVALFLILGALASSLQAGAQTRTQALLAEENEKSMKSVITSANESTENLQLIYARISKLNTDLESQKKTLASEVSQLTFQRACRQEFDSEGIPHDICDITPSSRKALTEKQAEIDRIDREIEKGKADLKAAAERRDKAHDKVRATKKESAMTMERLANQVSDLEREINTSKAFREYDSLKFKLSDVQDNLDQMERSIDKTLVGVYMRDKVDQLLSQMCDIGKQCADGKFDKKEALNKIFSSAPASVKNFSRGGVK